MEKNININIAKLFSFDKPVRGNPIVLVFVNTEERVVPTIIVPAEFVLFTVYPSLE